MALSTSAAIFYGPLAHAANWPSYLIREGQSGPQVKLLQSVLDQHGYQIPLTGYFGPITHADVVNFQMRNHLMVDGIVGPQTEAALDNSANASPVFGNARGPVYTVKPGDTLGAIAWRLHTTVSALQTLNHIANPNFIQVGQVLTIPGQAVSAPTATVSASTASGAGTRYTVVPGNTLSQIAARYGLSWQTLAQANHLNNPNVLYVGQVLNIPGSASSRASSAPPASQNTGSSQESLPVQASNVSFNQAIVNTAEKYLGAPYVWGGASPSGFDCSGLVQYVFSQNGVSVGRTSWQQYQESVKISRSQLQPGDLVFFNTYSTGASHVGIYIGSDPAKGYRQAFIDAPAPGQSVMVQNLNNVYWATHYVGAGYIRP